MQYCPKCKMEIRGNKSKCPLCQGKLTQAPEDPAFPTLKKRIMTSVSIMKVATFLFLTIEIVMGAVGLLAAHELGHGLAWVPLVMIGAVIAWADLLLAMYLRNNAMKIVTAEVYVAILVDVWIDKLTGFHGWSIIWMIPATFVGLAIVTLCIGAAAKLRLEDFIIYLAIDTVFCMMQIIPIMKGWNHFIWPAAICMVLFLILAAGTLVFRFRDLKNASAKYFNV